MLKVLTKGCEPTRGSKYSAAVDLYASEDCIIAAGETKIIGLGVAIDFSDNWKYKNGIVDSHCFGAIKENIEHNSFRYFKRTHYLELHPRSSLRAKGLISNTGIIDLDYEDEIKIIVHNPIKPVSSRANGYMISEEWHRIKKGDKIAQILLKEHKSYLFDIESDEERTGGFGSTGK